jgi:uncharacterized protein YcfJ
MQRIAASILAVALIAAGGTASAQNAGYSSPADRYGADRLTQAEGAYFDYARVLRVDPVLTTGTRPVRVQSDECYSEDGYYADRDDDRYYDDRYRDDRYADRRYDDRYRDDRYRDDRYRDDRYYDGRYRGEGGQYGTETGRNVATVIGGLVGAALGSKVGGGSARYATAAVGSMVGGMAGREIYETSQRNKQPPRRARVTVCDPVREGDYARYPTGADNVTAYDVTYEYAGRQYITRTTYHPGDRIRVRVDVRPE